jgi:hypothetical protein
MRCALACLLALAAMAGPAHAALWTYVPPRQEPASGPGVRAVVARAAFEGAISARDARRWRADLAGARDALRRLDGARGAELASAFPEPETLTVSRMPLAFLTLQRNTVLWRSRPFPAPGERMTFGRDPAVFQYFPGRGVQFHPLGTAGKANALADRPRRFRALLDRLVALSSRRAGFTAWEYRFDFGGGTAPWISAMTQATAAQALARGYEAFGDERYRDAALSALGAFEAPPPVGVALGREYLMYSFSPGLHIINGFLQALIGLHDVAELTGSKRARRLYVRGERAARGMLRDYDTGAWSRYSYAGRESTLDYHELVTGFLDGLCERTERSEYCRAAKRFDFYLHEPPQIRLSVPHRATQNHGTGFTVWVSKISALSVTVSRGAVDFSTTLPRGSLPYSFTPRRHGTYRIRVAATGPEGLTAVRSARLRVRIDPAILRARRRAARQNARRRHDRSDRTARARVRARDRTR